MFGAAKETLVATHRAFATQTHHTHITHRACTSRDLSEIGNGLCQTSSNNEKCGWDGGDCCQSDCVDGDTFQCGYATTVNGTRYVGFTACADPDTCQGNLNGLGNGFCDVASNNNAACNWDGGDWCACRLAFLLPRSRCTYIS